jgi:hypothetical protein
MHGCLLLRRERTGPGSTRAEALKQGQGAERERASTFVRLLAGHALFARALRAERARGGGPPRAAATGAPAAQVHVFGEWAGKIEALVRRLNHLHRTDPDAKSLVRMGSAVG